MAAEEASWTEVGERVCVGIRRENYGLISQRLRAISARECKDRGWRVEYGGRVPVRMVWLGTQGAGV